MIASFINGRIRIRDEKLKSIAAASHIEKKLSHLKGILNVSINRRAGSILIFYDKTVWRIEQALYALADYLADYLDIGRVGCKRRISCIADRKTVNLGMLVSLALSMFAAALDIAALHITAGIVFLGFLGLHLFRYKNMLFA